MVNWLVNSFNYSFIHSLVRSFIRTFMHSIIHPFIHSFIHSFNRRIDDVLVVQLIDWLIGGLNDCLICSLFDYFVHVDIMPFTSSIWRLFANVTFTFRFGEGFSNIHVMIITLLHRSYFASVLKTPLKYLEFIHQKVIDPCGK